jgi:formylmethanofuran dehydrogenase subunit E
LSIKLSPERTQVKAEIGEAGTRLPDVPRRHTASGFRWTARPKSLNVPPVLSRVWAVAVREADARKENSMPGASLRADEIRRVAEFDGHWCPGLAIGVRAGELALAEFGRAEDEDIVAVMETDMCGVDAIQVLTGCTFGTGNVLHKDSGKTAFTFYRRRDGKARRLLIDGDRLGAPCEEMTALQQERAGTADLTPEKAPRLESCRAEWTERIMGADPAVLFHVQALSDPPPPGARFMASLACEACGKRTMASRARLFDGRTLCLPRFEQLDRRM